MDYDFTGELSSINQILSENIIRFDDDYYSWYSKKDTSDSSGYLGLRGFFYGGLLIGGGVIVIGRYFYKDHCIRHAEVVPTNVDSGEVAPTNVDSV